jgi:hypothetical protein
VKHHIAPTPERKYPTQETEDVSNPTYIELDAELSLGLETVLARRSGVAAAAIAALIAVELGRVLREHARSAEDELASYNSQTTRSE